MKIAVIYDSSESTARTICASLEPVHQKEGVQKELIDVAQEELKACIGCFGCWVKTPGVCIHTKDSGTAFLRKIFDTDFLVIISKITWGGYSRSIKAYADRMLPLLHPNFRKVNGEMHHRLRYGKMPVLLAVGFDGRSEKENETFMKYTDAHRDNLAVKLDHGTFLWNGESSAVENNSEACLAWLNKEVLK